MVEVKLKGLPEGLGEATVQAWYFEEGDAVSKGDEIAELVTDEGTVTVTASANGILAEVYYDEGESVSAGEVLCLIEDEEGVKEDGSNDREGEEDKE